MSTTSRRRRAARRAVLATQVTTHDLHAALATLGLPEDASPDEVRDAVASLRQRKAVASVPTPVRYAPLAGAPEADESGPGRFGPDEDVPSSADDELDALAELEAEFAEPVLVGAVPAGSSAEDPFDGLLDDDADGPVFRRRRRAGSPPPAPVAARPTGPKDRPRPGRPVTRSPLLLLVIVLLSAVLVVVVQQAGQPALTAAGSHASGLPTVASAVPQTAAAPVLDEAKVADLTAKAEASPRDPAALTAVGDEYSRAAQPEQARVWHERAVAADPTYIDARLALGVDLYTLGDLAGAKEQWTAVTSQDPKQAEAWFNLGFLHFSTNPPDLAAAESCWAKVTELAPGTELASVAQGHLSRLRAAASASPTTNPTR